MPKHYGEDYYTVVVTVTQTYHFTTRALDEDDAESKFNLEDAELVDEQQETEEVYYDEAYSYDAYESYCDLQGDGYREGDI